MESTMGDAIRTSKKSSNINNKRRFNGAEEESRVEDHEEEEEGEEKCDDELWETLSKGFRQAQSVLDQNRALIQQVNDNHRSRATDNLAKNVPLIREINGNISKVISIYSDLSVNFSSIVQHRRGIMAEKKGEDEDEDEDEKPGT